MADKSGHKEKKFIFSVKVGNEDRKKDFHKFSNVSQSQSLPQLNSDVMTRPFSKQNKTNKF